MNKARNSVAKPARPVRHAPVALGAEAARLLTALAREGAYALPDPMAPEGWILREGGTGVSVGGGRFGGRAGTELLAADLAEQAAGRRARLTISPAGRARLRRAEAAHSPYLAQHLDLEGDAPEPGRPVRDASESPLAWMARRRDRDGAPSSTPPASRPASACAPTSPAPP